MEFNKTITREIQDYSFGGLPKEVLHKIFKNGRVFAQVIEHYISHNFDNLEWVPGNRPWDFTDANGGKYDEKTFTKTGCRLMQSRMIGAGRVFNLTEFHEHAAQLNYIIVDNIDFPNIKIKCVKGSDLIQNYPRGKIPFCDREQFFTD